MPTIFPPSLVRKTHVERSATTEADAQQALRVAFERAVCAVETWARGDGDVAFRDFEDALRAHVFGVARAAIVLFLVLRERAVMERYPAGERVRAWCRIWRRGPAIARNLTTMFGVVCFSRTYMREVAVGKRTGFHPLDVSLGLPKDRFSWNVLAKATWLATKLSFAEARATLAEFLPDTPSTEVIEKAALGLGRFAERWLVERSAPEDDGEVLIIMPDGKGIPTATEEELRRRRGPRRRKQPERSPRHRGRDKRGRHPKKPRRKKGDKSKNAKVATTIVMYTLRRRGTRRLEGPINKWVYSSFAPKRHAFEVARRWADTRGFTRDSGKLIQVVSDGDNDLADLCIEYFPEAEHTIDFWHVAEYLWSAGGCFFEEGSVELKRWVEEQKDNLFRGRIDDILVELEQRFARIAPTGPGNKGRRERLSSAIEYIRKRRAHIDYGSLRRRDLEISSGPVEGAIKHIIGKRQDHGGMRWIKERAEAILKLRCIEVCGNWDAFERAAHDQLHSAAVELRRRFRLQAETPQPLPQLAEAA